MMSRGWGWAAALLLLAAAAHAALAIQALAYAALGFWLSARVRYPALAIPLAVGVLLAAVGAIWAVDPFLRGAASQGQLLYAALLPNPVTAVASALDTD